MVNDLTHSPAWICTTLILAFFVYGMGRMLYETLTKRWSLITIAKRLSKIERALKRERRHAPPVDTPPQRERPNLRLVHSVKERPQHGPFKPNEPPPPDAA